MEAEACSSQTLKCWHSNKVSVQTGQTNAVFKLAQWRCRAGSVVSTSQAYKLEMQQTAAGAPQQQAASAGASTAAELDPDSHHEAAREVAVVGHITVASAAHVPQVCLPVICWLYYFCRFASDLLRCNGFDQELAHEQCMVAHHCFGTPGPKQEAFNHMCGFLALNTSCCVCLRV